MVGVWAVFKNTLSTAAGDAFMRASKLVDDTFMRDLHDSRMSSYTVMHMHDSVYVFAQYRLFANTSGKP